jgi:hypothetical protein
MVPDWQDFWNFVRDVGERPSKRHRLHSIDKKKPIGPGNFEWREPSNDIGECASKAEYMRKWARQYRDRNPEKFARYNFAKNYGITYDDYVNLLEKQNGVCSICTRKEETRNPKTGEPRNLAVDHCHAKGRVRSLLCSKCNTGLGLFRDDPALLRAAALYLEQHAELA